MLDHAVLDSPAVDPLADTLPVDPLTVVLATHGPFELRAMTVTPVGDPTYDEWAAAFHWCTRVEKASPFWVGDLLAYGDRYGEPASQMLEASQYAEQSLSNMKYTATAIPPPRRKATVPYSHHNLVAPLPPDEQDYWLAKCEAEELTRQQLDLHIKAAKAKKAGTEPTYVLTVTCHELTTAMDLCASLKAQGWQVKLQTVKESPKPE